MTRLTSGAVLAVLMAASAVPVHAAPTTWEINSAYTRLVQTRVVQGIALPDGSVDPAWDQPLTRAQLLVVLVRLLGEEENAAKLQGSSPFDDVARDAWYAGYVALADQLAQENSGQALGRPDGSFAPDQEVTVAEAVAFLSKMVGVPVGTGQNWATDTITSAQAAGLISAHDLTTITPQDTATRGLVFYLLDWGFSSHGYGTGQTQYTKRTDEESSSEVTIPALARYRTRLQPPTIALDSMPGSTTSAYVTVAGKVTGTIDHLLVNEKPVAVGAEGEFSTQVSLQFGLNTITVRATDRLGRTTQTEAKVTRNLVFQLRR